LNSHIIVLFTDPFTGSTKLLPLNNIVKHNMFRVARDNPTPRGRRGRVWTRFPTALDEILEEDEENVEVEVSEVGENGDRGALPDTPPQIIITPPTPEMNCPVEWPTSGPARQGTERSLWAPSTEGDCQPPEQPGTSQVNVSSHPSGATPAKSRSNEADFGASGVRSSNNRTSHLSLTKANKFVNKIILSGVSSWEFRWISPGENPRPLQLGWSKLVPQGYIQISRRSHHSTTSGNDPSAAGPESGKYTQQSGSSFQGDRDRLKERRKKMQKHLEALSRPVSLSLRIEHLTDG
jgi:hypothetical protein